MTKWKVEELFELAWLRIIENRKKSNTWASLFIKASESFRNLLFPNFYSGNFIKFWFQFNEVNRILSRICQVLQTFKLSMLFELSKLHELLNFVKILWAFEAFCVFKTLKAFKIQWAFEVYFKVKVGWYFSKKICNSFFANKTAQSFRSQ